MTNSEISTNASSGVVSVDRHAPLICSIKERYFLTTSSERTCHISLDLKNFPLNFEVGDSIGVCAPNPESRVQEILQAVHSAGTETLSDLKQNKEYSLRDYLLHRVNINRITSSFLKKLLEYAEESAIKNEWLQLLQPENKPALIQFLASHEPIDLLRLCSHRAPLAELFQTLSPLLPRFYSIASSPKLVPQEIHLTVTISSYTHKENLRYGIASCFLCYDAALQTTPIPIFVQKALHFGLPEDDALPIIMVGPGTGVAPFRAFLQERIARKASGKNWLFFGERHAKSDFFYQEFFEKHSDKLKLSLAFSRDQAEKIYVQHRMYEEKKEIFSWLQQGAILYVCGDAEKMAKDVDKTLHQIIEEEGSLSPEAAKEYIKDLRKQKRYRLDIY